MGKQQLRGISQIGNGEITGRGKTLNARIIAKSLVATSVILGSFVPQALASTTGSTMQQVASVKVDGSALSKPFIVVRTDSGVPTTYLPMYYVNQALAKAGYSETWNGNTRTWALTTSLKNLDFSNVQLGSGNTTITINGQAIKKINTFAQHDPATGKTAGETVYIPIYYVDALFDAAGISGMWDGSTHAWTLTTPVNLETDATYGPATGTQTVKKNINVLGTNVTIQNTTITGNMYINPGANGDVYLKNVKVSGSIVILSGAPHSIHLGDVTAPQLVINSTSAVHVVTEGTTTISRTQVGAADKEAVTLEQQSGSLGDVTVTAKQAVTLTGAQPFANVNVQGAASLTVDKGATVKTISVSVSSAHVTVSTGANVSTVTVANVTGITLDNEGTITTLQNQAPSTNGVTLTGQGTVTTTTGTAPSTGDGGQTSTGGGVSLPPTPAPAPTSSVSLVSITPKPGSNLNGTTSVDFSVVINYTSAIDGGSVTAELGKASGESFSLGSIPVQKGSGQVTITKTGVTPADLAAFMDTNQKVYLAIGLKDSNGSYGGTWQQLPQYSYDLSTPSTTLPALSAPSPQVSGMKVTWRGSKFASGYLVKVYSGSTVVDQMETGSSTSADLAKRNLPSGDYTVTVTAEGDNVTYVSSPESSPVALTITALDAPTGIQTDTTVPLAVDWSPVTSASGYTVRVYDQTGNTLLKSTGTDASTHTQNIADLGLPGGQYKVSVVAEGDDTTVADSVESMPFDFTMVALSAPAPTIDNMTVSWAQVPGATGYDVIVHDSNGQVFDTESVDASTTSFDLSQPGYPAGTYTVGVVAKGDNTNAVDSTEGMASGDVTLNPVTAPTNVVTAGTDVMWDAVTGATGYRVGLMDSSGKLIDVSTDLTSTTTDYDVTGFGSQYTPGDYAAVMALGDGLTTSNSGPSTPVLVNPLPVPGNVRSAGTILMWDSVPNADGYEVALVDGSNHIVGQATIDPSTTQFDVSQITGYNAGDYAFVYAMGDGVTFSDSGDSGEVLIKPLDAPTNVSPVGTDLMWDAVTNATGYEVVLLDSNMNYVDEASTTATDYELTQFSNYQPGDYALVYAVGDGTTYSDSDDSLAALVNPLATPAATVNGTVVSWNAIPNATGYTVEIFDGTGVLVGNPYSVTTTSIDLSTLSLSPATYTVYVVANDDKATYTDSDVSNSVQVVVN